MIQLSTNTDNAAATPAATPPAAAPAAAGSQPPVAPKSNEVGLVAPQPGEARPENHQPPVHRSVVDEGTSALNSRAASKSAELRIPHSALRTDGDPQPLFPQSTGESDRAFEAFRAYLELGPQRRYAAVGRKVGASFRTVKRWASDFDWRGRIKNHSAQLAGQYTEAVSAVQREEFLDAAARAKTFRDRQYALAEALLETAERYLESMDADDPDQMSFSDACKALELASRLGGQAAGDGNDSASGNGRALSDHLATLLDQAYRETPPPKGAAAQPNPAASC